MWTLRSENILTIYDIWKNNEEILERKPFKSQDRNKFTFMLNMGLMEFGILNVEDFGLGYAGWWDFAELFVIGCSIFSFLPCFVRM